MCEIKKNAQHEYVILLPSRINLVHSARGQRNYLADGSSILKPGC